MHLICPTCKQVSTFRQYFDEVHQHSAPVAIGRHGLEVDYDNTELVQTCLMEDDPEIVECERCFNDVDIRDIKILKE